MSKLWKCITVLSTFLWHHLTTKTLKTWNVYEGREHRATNFLFFQGSYRFFIQNSRLFPDFFQNNNLFFQTQGYQIGDQSRPLKKRRNKTFSMTCRRDWIRFDQHEKKFTSEGLVVRLSKKLKTFYHFFKTLPLFSRLFPGLENCWANFKTFSRIRDSLRTLPFLSWIRSFTIQLQQKFDFI